MRIYLLKMFISLFVLLGIVTGIALYFDFAFSSTAFVVGAVACLITYSGSGFSAMGEANASISQSGGYLPKGESMKTASSLNPYLIASILTFISSFTIFILLGI